MKLVRAHCGWCWRLVKGQGVTPLDVKIFNDLGQYYLERIYFCSGKCAWRFGVEHHRDAGLRGKDLRAHLWEEHGLV